MKKIIFFIAFTYFSVFSFSQTLRPNQEGGFQCDSVFYFQDSKLIETLKTRVLSYNYENLQYTESQINASNNIQYTNGIKVKYKIRIEIKVNRYLITFTNFIIQTQHTSNFNVSSTEETILEDMTFRKMWVKKIDKELPRMFKDLDLNTVSKKKEW